MTWTQGRQPQPARCPGRLEGARGQSAPRCWQQGVKLLQQYQRQQQQQHQQKQQQLQLQLQTVGWREQAECSMEDGGPVPSTVRQVMGAGGPQPATGSRRSLQPAGDRWHFGAAVFVPAKAAYTGTTEPTDPA